MFAYIKQLGGKQSDLTKIIEIFSKSSNQKLTDLRKRPCNPIGDILSIQSELPEKEHQILQSFLCCQLARNYFAHHDYFHHELTRSEKSQFLLRGILLTVLILLKK